MNTIEQLELYINSGTDVPLNILRDAVALIKELQKDSNELAALHAGGVDNWEWYSESLQEFWEE